MIDSLETKTSPSRQSLRGLDWLNFFLADVQTGVGPFLAIYLAGYKWNEAAALESGLNIRQLVVIPLPIQFFHPPPNRNPLE
jgi:hypothetical protein